MLLGPVNFQGMRPKQTPVTEAPTEAASGQVHGLQVFGSKTFVDRKMIESAIHRPWAHHEAENLLCATHDMCGPSWSTSNALPSHIARNLNSIKDFHEEWG